MPIKPVSFTRKPFGYGNTSYLTKARADKEIEELNAAKADIEARIAELQKVKDVSVKVEEKPAMTREETVKAARRK
ncbi:hypothetical protein [Aeromonas veronii]|uniref:hypothetical protein n=1 Tax=Aeromonas veronii TaxID=654 RepID=UPI001CD7AE03|nr:hypothetical protein [Aeromonas veronii]UBR47443.1 hypothetical protein LAG74_10195 [Aeromonas veronii]